MKRILVLAMALIMALSCVSFASAENDVVTITYFGNNAMAGSGELTGTLGKFFNDRGLNIEVVPYSTEKLQAQLASGDLADVIFLGQQEMQVAAESGLILHCEFNIMVDTQPHWVVQGTKGTIFIRNGDIEVHKITYPGPINPAAYRSKFDDAVESYPLPGQYHGDRYWIYTHIADVIRGNCEYYVPLTFTRNLTDVCDAIHKSAATGEVVHLSVEDWIAPL